MQNTVTDHWERVYQTRLFDTVSWYAPHLRDSFNLITTLAPTRTAAVIDVGGGESTLVDDLLDAGYSDLTVVDIAATALDFTRARLGPDRAAQVVWRQGDITQLAWDQPRFDLWHDRAVFHFLTSPEARAAYVQRVREAVRPGGYVVVATFGPQGPLQCSGLDVMRYDAEGLHDQFGAQFELLGSRTIQHGTPVGILHQFLYCWCKVG